MYFQSLGFDVPGNSQVNSLDKVIYCCTCYRGQSQQMSCVEHQWCKNMVLRQQFVTAEIYWGRMQQASFQITWESRLALNETITKKVTDESIVNPMVGHPLDLKRGSCVFMLSVQQEGCSAMID